MATTLTLPYKRFTAQVNTGAPEAKANYKALAQRNAIAMESCQWSAASDDAAASLVDHDFKKTFADSRYDAFLMTGAYDSTANTEIAYAGMVAYRFKLPAAYASGAATLVSASLQLNRDRFLLPGLRVSVAGSDSEEPSTSWAVVRGDAEGCVKLSAQLPNSANRITASEPAIAAVEVDLSGLDSSAKPTYLWVYLTVEDYTATWDWYSSTQHRLYAIEGSGMLVAQSSSVTFSADVAADSGPSVQVFYVARAGSTQGNYSGRSARYVIELTMNGDTVDDYYGAMTGVAQDIVGNTDYDLQPIEPLFCPAQDVVGLRALYAAFFAGRLKAIRTSASHARSGAGFLVQYGSVPLKYAIGEGTSVDASLLGWRMVAASLLIPFSAPISSAASRIWFGWDVNGTGGPANGGRYNFWLKRGEYVYDPPDETLKNPDIYIGASRNVDGWELLGSSDAANTQAGTVEFALDNPLESRIATVMVTAFAGQDGISVPGVFSPVGVPVDATGGTVSGEYPFMRPTVALISGDGEAEVEDERPEFGGLTFTALEAGSTISMSANGGAPIVNLQTSLDEQTWVPFIVGETTITLANIGDKVCFSAVGTNTVFKGNRFVMSGKIAASGDISSLLSENGCVDTLAAYAFYGLFDGCTSLTTAPTLPAMTLAYGCYEGMFSGCTSLTTAPTLPATTLASKCYWFMFHGCTSLTTVPTLPAPTLTEYCYYNMFSGCTALTTVPVLPATTLAKGCYEDMFSGCTSLTTAPTLPAMTLAVNCYEDMFRGCTALTTVPVLPATTLAERCDGDMFGGCTSLTTAPTLPATTLADVCYWFMFNGCTSLSRVSVAFSSWAGDATQGWLYGVAANGVFECPAALDSTVRNNSKVPENWTVQTF